MQNPRQNESVQFPAARPLPCPQNRYASVLHCLAIAAIAIFFALPNQSAAQATKTWIGDWAGYILYAPNQMPLQIPASRFTTIEADWIVPDATPTIKCSDLWPAEKIDGSSIWIGLDGWGYTYNDSPGPPSGAEDTDILQAGTETDIHCDDGNQHSSNAYFWIEWDGTANIPVAPGQDTVVVPVGDTVHVNIAVDTTTWQEATVIFVDKKPNGDINQSYTTTFPSGCLYTYCGKVLKFATLFGNTAEWVVESTFYGGKNPNGDPNPNSLNNFSTTQMTNMSVVDNNGVVYTPGNPQNYPGNNTNPQLDWMSWTGNGDITNQNNVLLACPAITDAQTITLTRAPFDIVVPEQQINLSPKPTSCN